MTEKQYYRLVGDTAEGEDGLYYYEVDNGEITRQVCVVGELAYWADESEEADDTYGFPDKTDFDEELIPDFANLKRIDGNEFDEVWSKSKTQFPEVE